MTYGQGASSALPIWAYYMTKVYRDKSLGYLQTETFDIRKDTKAVDLQLPAADSIPATPDNSGGIDALFD